MYWDDRKVNLRKSKNFTFNILISIFPLASIFFYIAIGYFNPRYNRNYTTAIASILVISFVIIANQLSKLYPNMGLLILPIVWFILGYIYYWLTVRKLY
jgi:lipopolysaccharide export system permease protein